MIAYLFRAKVFECLCNLNLYSLSRRRVGKLNFFTLFPFFFHQLAKFEARPPGPSARASGRRPIGYRKSYTQLWRPNIAFRESHDDGKEGADLPIIQPKWQSDINGRSTPFVFRMLNVGGGRIHNHIPNLISLFFVHICHKTVQ